MVAALAGLLVLPASPIFQTGSIGTTHVASPRPGSPSPVGHLQGSAAIPPGDPARERTTAAGAGLAPALGRPDSMINPVQFYTREPAPMGVADFGITGQGPGAAAYEYSSPIFQGQAVVRSMSVTISGTTSKVTAFELNAVLYLQRNGSNYTYWIQNGIHLDASSHEFTIGGAYVWNFSSPSAKLSSGEVVGAAGSILSGDTYYFMPGCGPTFPGQCSTLGLPTTLLGRILSATSSGTPYVDYQYNLGSGWVTYDNVSFAHMAGANDSGFRVDGFVPTPISAGLYYDTEWDWVGAGGGSGAVDQGSDIDLSLELWNGHNYQAVPTAWNFGSNTGETSSNVSDLLANASTVEPAADLASGPGSLGVLYNRSSVGFLNLTVPTTLPATVLVDGVPVSFHGGWANVTLDAGSHALYLQNFTNASDSFEVGAGATTFVNLTGAGRIAFTESGLPVGTAWGVSVNGTPLSSARSSVVANLPNGTYPILYTAVPGFYRTGSDPATLTLPGTSSIAIEFAPFTYGVTVSESGLPASSPWWVNASGTLVQSSGTTLQVFAPNGSTPFEAGAAYEFLGTPDQGTIRVTSGIATPVQIDFAYRPTFIVGTVVPADALVSIGGNVLTLSGGAFNDSVIPGTYAMNASASGYGLVSMSVIATPGNVTWENITLSANHTAPVNPPTVQSSGGGIPLETAVAIIVGVAIVGVAAVYLLVRRRGVG
ncbi:MAG: thermopsin [Thermoplasmata archaeon]|nr:thermopsin [Thermoplasmata archaeon]